MAESRKILVAFDPKKPDKSSSDYLVPVRNDLGDVEFLGTHSQKIVAYGTVILLYHPITENDLFAKLVHTDRKIPNVGNAISMFVDYLESVKMLKIGKFVEIDIDTD